MVFFKVRAGWIFQQPDYLKHEENLWDLFSFSELTTVMRQRSRDRFFNLLQRLRIGTNTKEDIQTLSERKLSPLLPNYNEMLKQSEASLHLYPTVKMVDEYNQKRLEELRNSGVKVYKLFARDTYANGPKYGTKVPPNLIKDDIRSCAGIPTVLEIGIGCKVMLKVNISPLNGKNLL